MEWDGRSYYSAHARVVRDDALRPRAGSREHCSVCRDAICVGLSGTPVAHGPLKRCTGVGQPTIEHRARAFAAAVRVRAFARGLPDDWTLDREVNLDEIRDVETIAWLRRRAAGLDDE